MMNKFLKKWDVLLLLTVAVGCGLWLLLRTQAPDRLEAVVYHDGAVVETVDLALVATPYTIELEGNPSAVLEVERGRIRYLSASCPDGLCVSTGWLNHAGDTAACLPGKTIVTLTKGKADLAMTY